MNGRAVIGLVGLAWVLGLWSCGGSQSAAPGLQAAAPRASTGGWLDWPPLGGREVPSVGGGERDAAVIVAIEKYLLLPEVSGATVSADDWYDYFTHGLEVPKSRVQLLKVNATEKKMEEAVALAAGQAAQEGGRLWFVFIGHGAPITNDSGGRLEGKDGLLVDYRAEAGDLTGLRHSTLMAAMAPAARGGQQPVTILDACYSGKLAADEGSGSRSLTGGQMTAFKFEPPTPKGVLVLSAAASDQVAFPLPGLPQRRPAFSYLLLGGLRGWADHEGNGDGQVTADEAIGFTQFALSQFGRAQRPQLQGVGAQALARAGEVPPVDVRAYAKLLASGGAHPACNDGYEWREGACKRPVEASHFDRLMRRNRWGLMGIGTLNVPQDPEVKGAEGAVGLGLSGELALFYAELGLDVVGATGDGTGLIGLFGGGVSLEVFPHAFARLGVLGTGNGVGMEGGVAYTFADPGECGLAVQGGWRIIPTGFRLAPDEGGGVLGASVDIGGPFLGLGMQCEGEEDGD